jgi:hypothetical protein
MSNPRKTLRLGPLPKIDTVKLTITLPAEVRAELERYAALHAETYGEPVEAVTLIPHMLEAFMARDRGFRRKRTDQSHPNPASRPVSAQNPTA